jgi:hypothetical protein
VELVGGERGSNRAAAPPDMSRFLRWLWVQPRVQALVERRRLSGGLVRIAVVTHGAFLKAGVPLRKHPRNNGICSARLQVGEPRDLGGAKRDAGRWWGRPLAVRLMEVEVSV